MSAGEGWSIHGPLSVGPARVWALALPEPHAGDHAEVEALTAGWPVPPTGPERASCADWGHAGARLHRLAGRVLLRHAVSEALGCAPRDVVVEATPAGQPVLRWMPRGPDDAGWQGSIAHTQGLAVAAVAPGAVGVDVERLDRVLRWERLVGRVFAEASEREALEVEPVEAREHALRERWVVLEAVAKATGAGLARTLGAAPVVRARAPGVWLVELGGTCWAVRVEAWWGSLIGVALPGDGAMARGQDG